VAEKLCLERNRVLEEETDDLPEFKNARFLRTSFRLAGTEAHAKGLTISGTVLSPDWIDSQVK
jgi:hypothetical protein